ncbi:MAG: hypothetical protein ACLFP9_01580 [Desulfonatronovibrio sp.]
MKKSLPGSTRLAPSSVFFGQYLLNKGVINSLQLDQAIDFQQKHNKLLGQMAIEKGYMTESQVEKAKAEQKNLDLSFGVIAVDKGYMTPHQLDDLLFTQIVNTTHVGEALVELGHLPPEDLGRNLKNYNQEEGQRLQAINKALDKIDVDFPVKACIHSLDRAFIRFAHQPINVVSVEGRSDNVRREWSFVICIEMHSRDHLYMEVKLSGSNVRKIAGESDVRESGQGCGPRCLGRNLLFFTIVKRYLAAQLIDDQYPVAGARMIRKSDQDPGSVNSVRIYLSSPAGKFEVRLFAASDQN